MARVWTIKELKIKLKALRDYTGNMLALLKDADKYEALNRSQGADEYADIATNMDTLLSGLDAPRDDMVDLLTALTFVYEREVVVRSAEVGGPSSYSINCAAAGYAVITIHEGDLVGVFQSADEIEITHAENPDHNGIYTISSFPGLIMNLSDIMTTGSEISVTSIIRSGTTATLTTATAHGRVTGDYIKVAGASQSAYNGVVQVTRVSDTVLTYTVSGSPATPATGTITMIAAAADNTEDTSLVMRLYAR